METLSAPALAALPARPSWATLRGEVRRSTWGPDGLAMSVTSFAAHRRFQQVSAWAAPAPGRDLAMAPIRRVAAPASGKGAGTVTMDDVMALLRPRRALERLALQIVGERRMHRRRVLALSGRIPQGADPAATPFGMLSGGDSFRFLVDAGRGIVLLATGFADGSVIDRVEFAALRFDIPLLSHADSAPPRSRRRSA
ncbi:hypothetical protein ACFOYW_08465 [Gryllotalpicola reticulitermitis]|uniref:Uncharacterized protein n=1 Tax=Gryllotalpicola reticulitermitis TaxID=1184153 RepID=A0ABV8Q7T1_9MICO